MTEELETVFIVIFWLIVLCFGMGFIATVIEDLFKHKGKEK